MDGTSNRWVESTHEEVSAAMVVGLVDDVMDGDCDGAFVGKLVGDMVGLFVGEEVDASVSHVPHVPGQCIITSSIAHRAFVFLLLAHEHFFHGFEKGLEVISNRSTEEKSLQHLPHVLGQLEMNSSY